MLIARESGDARAFRGDADLRDVLEPVRLAHGKQMIRNHRRHDAEAAGDLFRRQTFTKQRDDFALSMSEAHEILRNDAGAATPSVRRDGPTAALRE